MPEGVTAVSQQQARDEGLARVVGWIRQLREVERLLVLHCGLGGLPFGEVGERLQLSRDAVAKRWQRLRAHLAAHPLPRVFLA